MIVLFCVLVAVVALLDFILLMFIEIIGALFNLIHKIQYRRSQICKKKMKGVSNGQF